MSEAIWLDEILKMIGLGLAEPLKRSPFKPHNLYYVKR